MAQFRRRQQPEAITVIDCGGDGKAIEVKGEATYQKALERIAGPKTAEGGAPDVVAYLEPDPSNPYDSNAVKVFVTGLLVGYINRDDAEWVQKTCLDIQCEEGGKLVAMKGQLVGGWDRGGGDEGSWGIWLWYDPDLFQ